MSAPRLTAAQLTDILQRFARTRAWVVGDVMLDEYIVGDVRRISPDAPVQVVNVRESFHRLGGAANVAHGIVTLGGSVELAAALADDDAGRRIRSECERSGIGQRGLVEVTDRPTTRKLRVLARRQHVLRMDWESAAPVSEERARAAFASLCRGPAPDVIVVSDYAKGMLSPGLLDDVARYAAQERVALLVDPKRADFADYGGATVITPNLKELALAAGLGADETSLSLAEVEAAARTVMDRARADALIVTMGERGMLVVPRVGAAQAVRATAREVYDVTGAGDTVITLLALGLGAGLDLVLAAEIANLAAGVVVEKVGTAVVRPQELAAAFGGRSMDKVLTREQARECAAWWRLQGKKVVFTNGCFDLLHVGHVSLLREAARQGDALIVGVNSDASVRRLKGAERPLIPESERAHLVAALDCVDGVTLFEEDTPAEIIAELRPDVLVKGADYRLADVVGRDVVEAGGGKVVLVPLVPNHSTSNLVERIRGSSR